MYFHLLKNVWVGQVSVQSLPKMDTSILNFFSIQLSMFQLLATELSLARYTNDIQIYSLFCIKVILQFIMKLNRLENLNGNASPLSEIEIRNLKFIMRNSFNVRKLKILKPYKILKVIHLPFLIHSQEVTRSLIKAQ